MYPAANTVTSQYWWQGALGACPRIVSLLWKSWIWPDSPIIFVKYAQYSPQMIEKSESNQLSLATAPILGQAPSPCLILSQQRHALDLGVYFAARFQTEPVP